MNAVVDRLMSRLLAPRLPARKEIRRSHHRIAVVTGTRAEYGLLKSTMRALARTKGAQLQLIATGMHLLERFGRTVDQIRDDGWQIDAAIKMQRGNDGPLDQAEGLSRGVAGIAQFLERVETDVVVVLGDRIEAMAGALAAVTTGKVLTHIHGGDLAPGDLDDGIRHAITKLAHLHLAATRSAARRIIRMGEAKERVHVVGAPGLDDLRALAGETRRKRRAAGKEIPLPHRFRHRRGDEGGGGGDLAHARKRTAIILHHPCGRPAAQERRVMQTILRAVDDAKLEALCIYPNSDRGSSGIIEAIEAHAQNGRLASGFRTARSLDRDEYLRRLIGADLLIGNSSSGIIEAATAGTPAVDIGPRQHGRETSGRSVIHAEESYAAVRAAIKRALRLGPINASRSAYGDGRAGERIAQLLIRVPVTEAYRRKLNSY